jgi:hypothetical protein
MPDWGACPAQSITVTLEVDDGVFGMLSAQAWGGSKSFVDLGVQCRTAALRVQRKKSIDFNQTFADKNPERNVTSLP